MPVARYRTATLLFAALVFLSPTAGLAARVGAAPITTPGAVPRFEPGKCPFTPGNGQAEGTNLFCGTVIVPEFHANPGGRTLRLAVAQFKSQSPTPAAEPIVYLEGGPGGASLDSSISGFAARFTPQHDFIAFDQRGVGYSQPNLACPEVTESFRRDDPQNIDIGTEEGHRVAATWACRDRLMAQGVNLGAYTSAESAGDVNDIRAALGYEKVKLVGVSYGSRLALAVLRLYPQIVHSAVIDGVSPPQVDQYAGYAVSFDRSLNLMFSACAADPDCYVAFPTLKADFSQAVARLDAQPMTFTSEKTGATIVMNGWRFVSLVFNWLYDSSLSRYLPILISEVKNGDTTLLGAIYTKAARSDDTTASVGMAYSVRCAEYTPFSSPEAVTAAAQNVLPEIRAQFLPSNLTPFTICSQWPIVPPNPAMHQPVTSDVPTLVMESGNDPVTPPSNGQLAAQTLSRSFYVESPGIGHSVIGNSGKCGLGIALAFLAAPDTKPDTSCLAGLGIRYRTALPR
jgi:pimeloyl-ACP methyl ester carboxylesterase